VGTGSDDLFVAGLLLFAAAWMIPMASIGAAQSYHRLEMPSYANPYLGFLASRNDPDHPGHLLGKLLVGERSSEIPHPNHVLAGFANLALIAVVNLLPLVVLFANDPYETGSLARVMAAAFFVFEVAWFWWFRRFVAENQPWDRGDSGIQ
jgi:hypothetical protein